MKNKNKEFFRALFLCAICAGTVFLCIFSGGLINNKIENEKAAEQLSAAEDAEEIKPAGSDEKGSDEKSAGPAEIDKAPEEQEDAPNKKEEAQSEAGKFSAGKDEAPGKEDEAHGSTAEAPKEIKIAAQEEPLPQSNNNENADRLAREVFESADIFESKDGVFVSYSQPELPELLHLSVKASIYDEKGATLSRFVSDGGWMTHPENYDSCEKAVLEKMDADSLENKQFILEVRVTDNENESAPKTYVYQLTQSCDGSRSVQSALI